MAQIDHSSMIFSIIGVMFAINGIGIGIMFKIRANDKKELEDHKKTVQFKDTCSEVVKGLSKLADERHQDMKEDLKEIKDLIRNNGNAKLRVQT